MKTVGENPRSVSISIFNLLKFLLAVILSVSVFLFLVNLKMGGNNIVVLSIVFAFFYLLSKYPAFVRVGYPTLGSAIMQHSHLCHIVVALSSYSFALILMSSYESYSMHYSYLYVVAVLSCHVGRSLWWSLVSWLCVLTYPFCLSISRPLLTRFHSNWPVFNF